MNSVILPTSGAKEKGFYPRFGQRGGREQCAHSPHGSSGAACWGLSLWVRAGLGAHGVGGRSDHEVCSDE